MTKDARESVPRLSEPAPKVAIIGDDIHGASGLAKFKRSTEFWARTVSIYASFKVTQVKAAALRLRGYDDKRIAEEVWRPQHEHAGKRMHELCIDMRGFYLKSGQFLGARGDFVPEPICLQLSKLHDQVPPMSAEQTRGVIEQELGGATLADVFEWIDLDKPLGSASLAQVHKAKLRLHKPPPRRWWHRDGARRQAEFYATMHPVVAAATAARMAEGGTAASDGIVAVKVQYPDALKTMEMDLGNIRTAAWYLSKTELKFDLVSPVDELFKQIRLEFDFEREAKVMDTIGGHLRAQGVSDRIIVPSSVPGLTSKRLLVMSFIDGIQITRLGDRMKNMSAMKRKLGIKRILGSVSEAYGRMMLYEGLFQADGHPGNILVMKGGKVGLIDYGQSKQLPDAARLSFAKLIIALASEDDVEINGALWAVGVKTPRDDVKLRSKMASGMFDTRGHVDPFDPNSPIKALPVEKFPSDMFFVLRVVQLLRGLASAMDPEMNFSSAAQWKPFAEDALRTAGMIGPRGVPPTIKKQKEWAPWPSVTATTNM